MCRRRVLGLAALPWLAPLPALALEQPASAPLLKVSGQVRNSKPATATVFDMAALERLPQQSFSTRTPWYAQPRKFTGPLLRDVLDAAGAQGTLLRAVALNDYWVDIPFDDIQRYDVLLARLLDDKPMTVRDKGPLFIIYPFDQRNELRNARYYSRCAWQVKAIEVQ